MICAGHAGNINDADDDGVIGGGKPTRMMTLLVNIMIRLPMMMKLVEDAMVIMLISMVMVVSFDCETICRECIM